MNDVTVHYTAAYRRMMRISAIPALLTAFFSVGGLLYMVLSGLLAQGEQPGFFYWLLVGVFAVFTAAVTGNALIALLRLSRNSLHVDENGITFSAWAHFTLYATWQQVTTLEERHNEREQVTVLILGAAQLEQAPLAKLLRRPLPSAPYPLVLDRFQGWPDGILRRTLAVYIPEYLD